MATDNNVAGQNSMDSGMTSAQIGNRMAGSMRGMSMQNGMQGMGDSMQNSEKRRAKKEYRAKMKRYKAKHNEAKAVFERIAGKAPETRMEAEEIYAEILKRGSAMEKSKAAFAIADFCWACDEKEAEKEVREEVDDFDTDED